MLVLLIAAVIPAAAETVENQRFYVGAAVCRQCHYSAADKDPYNAWFHSKHSRAYAVLGNPESVEIARLSGIDVNPFKSPVCLGCHTTASDTEEWRRDETFFLEDGVQCEYCHGPGSDYIDPVVMADGNAAKKAGLQTPGEDLCIMCHKPKGSHTTVLQPRPFDYNEFLSDIRHSGKAVTAAGPLVVKPARPGVVINKSGPETAAVTYKTPFNLALSSDDGLLYVVCEASDSLIVVDTGRREVIKEIAVRNQPHGVCLSVDGTLIFVSNRGSDSVTVIDTRSYAVLKHIAVGDEPHGLLTGPKGRTLYVANAGSNDISVVDLKLGREVKRLSAGRGAWDMCRSPDGGSVWVTGNLSHFVKFRTPSLSEVTVVDTGKSVVKHRVMLPGTNLVQGIDFAPGGEFALVTLIRTKNLLPITRVMQGWMITNGIGILWKDGRVDQLLLDETDRYFADPTDVVITPDGKYGYVSGGGIDSVAVIDLEKMKHILRSAGEKERKEVLPNHLGISAEYVLKRIRVGRSPRGLVASGDGRFVYVADALDDTVSVIDAASRTRSHVIDLGGPKEITLVRKGERIFHSAEITYGRQFSCHTCHPDGSVDGITYDIEPDGLGLNPVDNRTLRGILDTAPFKWTGKNKTLSRQCGPRLAIFFTRIDPFTPEQVTALERYICTIPRNPNRYRKGDKLTPAQRRGKHLFERRHTNSGASIPREQRCNGCHTGPYFTSRRRVDVGTASPLDTQGSFDVPHLNNIYESAPYLHDGRSDTLEEIWTRFNPDDRHGVTNDMTKDQLNDLIEYLKTL
jgi:YVTN family beta-propeller protein